MSSSNGLNLSPPLRWHGAPSATVSYALVLEDPDAPGGTWVHWVLFNLPAEHQGLPAGLDRAPQLPNGACQGACWGVADFHRYIFSLFALDTSLDLEPGITVAQLQQAMDGHQLALAQLTGLYSR